MNELYLFNLRKQGQVRFKMSLFQKEIGQDKKAKKKEVFCFSNCCRNPGNSSRKSIAIRTISLANAI